MTQRIVFLDIDGVLNNRSYIKKHWPIDANFQSYSAMIDPEKAERVNRIVAETGASIVVCSAWRLSVIPEAVFEVLRTGGVEGPFVGITPDCGRDRRDIEVAMWIREHSQNTGNDVQFIAIDDNLQMYPAIRGRVIQTSFETGITEGNVRAAIKLMHTPTNRKVTEFVSSYN